MKKSTIYFSFLALSLLACGNQEEEILSSIEADQIAKEQAMMDAENLAPDILKPSTLLTLKMLKEAFKIPDTEFIDFDDSDGKCAYDFVIGNKSHHVDLQFYLPGEMDDEKATKMYEQLSTKYIKPDDAPTAMDGVADKAIWSAMGGGQLIARYKNEILIINMSVIELTSMKNLGSSDEKMKNELKAIAKKMVIQIIEKLEKK